MRPDASPNPSVPTVLSPAALSPAVLPPTVLLATATDCWAVDEDAPALSTALASAGLNASPAVWDDPDVDWGAAELVVVRSTWDYPLRRDEFLDWADATSLVTELANPAAILRWNTDKRYLSELAESGIPVVDTTFLADGEASTLEIRHTLAGSLGPSGEVVVKPSVSAGSRDTGRFGAEQMSAASDLAKRILGAGRCAMVQPYLPSVDERGETGLVFFDGHFSHGFNKGPLLAPGGETEHGLFALESIAAHSATDAELAIGEQIVEWVNSHFDVTPLYARVDLVENSGGQPVLLELELTEPSWFLSTDAAAAGRAARAITGRVG